MQQSDVVSSMLVTLPPPTQKKKKKELSTSWVTMIFSTRFKPLILSWEMITITICHSAVKSVLLKLKRFDIQVLFFLPTFGIREGKLTISCVNLTGVAGLPLSYISSKAWCLWNWDELTCQKALFYTRSDDNFFVAMCLSKYRSCSPHSHVVKFQPDSFQKQLFPSVLFGMTVVFHQQTVILI